MLVLLISIFFSFPRGAFSFVASRQFFHRPAPTTTLKDTAIEIPLLDLPDDDEKFLLPLPTGSFPEELRTCSIQRASITLPLHKAILDEAVLSTRPLLGCCVTEMGGCAAEILHWEKKTGTLYYRGSYLFRIVNIERATPFRVARIERVERLHSDDTAQKLQKNSILLQDMLIKLAEYADHQVQAAGMKTPLEASLLESLPPELIPRTSDFAEERAAIVEILQTLVSEGSTEHYSNELSFLIADLCETNSNKERIQLLEAVDISARIHSAQTLVDSRTATFSTSNNPTSASTTMADLQIGPPQLPPWIQSMKKGMKVSYFWNEEWGWCDGVIVDDPMFIVDEWIWTVHFPDDGETHRLPVSVEDKARWRPA